MKTNAELLDALITEFGVLYPETKAVVKKKPPVRHVRTPAGVRKFRQAMHSVIKRDLVPSVEPSKTQFWDFAPKTDDKDAPTARDKVKSHVEDVAKQSKQKRNVGELDVALKMEANSRLHPVIKAKLKATEAGRAWLKAQSGDIAFQNTIKNIWNGESDQARKVRLKKLRDSLIPLNPNTANLTPEEQQAEADRLIVFGYNTLAAQQAIFNGAMASYLDHGSARSLFNAMSFYGMQEVTEGDKTRIRKMYAAMKKDDPEDAAVEKWTRKCIDTWAETAFDHNSLSIAMQATAETLYADDAYVDRFPHLGGAEKKVLADKVDTLIVENAPALVAFVSSVYEETQKSLQGMGIKKVRLYRGMTVTKAQMSKVGEEGATAKKVFTEEAFETFTKKFWPKILNDHLTSLDDRGLVEQWDGIDSTDTIFKVFKQSFKEWATKEYGADPEPTWGEDSGDGDDGELVKVHLQPLSATATTKTEASSFMHTSGSGTPKSGGVPVMFTMDVPIERIWSIPTHGPGCFGEDEVIVLGGTYTVRAKQSKFGYSDWGSEAELDFDEMLDGQEYQVNLGDLVRKEMLTRSKAKFAGLTGDALVTANREWFDTVGRTVDSNAYMLIGYQKRYDYSQELWKELDKRPETTYTIEEDWYGFLRLSGIPKMQAVELTMSLGDKPSKQPYNKIPHSPKKKVSWMKKAVPKKAAKKMVKKAPFKVAVKKPKTVEVSAMPSPWKLTYDEMVEEFYKTGAKGIATDFSTEQEVLYGMYSLARMFDRQGIAPKTKVTKAWIASIEKSGDWEWSGTDIYPNSSNTDYEGYVPPASLTKAMASRGYVWRAGAFTVPFIPSMKKGLPPESLHKPKVKKPAPSQKKSVPVKMAVAKKAPAKKMPVKKVTPLSKQYFDLGVDAKGKPKALNKFTGWIKQPDGSYRQKWDAHKPQGALVAAMKMHGWTFGKKDYHYYFYPPGYKASPTPELDNYGKPIAMKFTWGWHKQSDGSFVQTNGSSGGMFSTEIAAVRKAGWSYVKVGTNGNPTIYPPGHPKNNIGKKKTAAKKIVPKTTKKAAKKS